jgi:hypothetical protein
LADAMGEKLPPSFPMKLVTQRNFIKQTPPLMSLYAPKLPIVADVERTN